MGTMSCSRASCDSPMCSRYSNNFGYLCYECYNELTELQNLKPDMDMDYIENWINSSKPQVTLYSIRLDLNEEFENINL